MTGAQLTTGPGLQEKEGGTVPAYPRMVSQISGLDKKPPQCHFEREVRSSLISFCRIPTPGHRAHLGSLVSLEQVFGSLWSYGGPDPHTHLPGRDGVIVQ